MRGVEQLIIDVYQDPIAKKAEKVRKCRPFYNEGGVEQLLIVVYQDPGVKKGAGVDLLQWRWNKMTAMHEVKLWVPLSHIDV